MKAARAQYKELSAGKLTPYCFEIKKGRRALFYFGANHSPDPKDKQYLALEKYWARFLKNRNQAKTVVIEGGLRPVEENEHLAIMRGAEGSFITLLAHYRHIPIICPEPSKEEAIRLLRKRFRENVIQYFWFAQYVDSWHRQNPRPRFESYIKTVMRIHARQNRVRRFTLERMKIIHKKLFKCPFTQRNRGFFNSITSPNQRKTVVNRIARISSDLRDIAILQRLHTEWNSGRSLFVVYGSGHAFIHEAILKTSLE